MVNRIFLVEIHPDDWPLSLQPIYVVSDDHAESAVIANTSMTQEPPVDWKKSVVSQNASVLSRFVCV